MVGTYTRTVFREAIPKIDSFDLLLASIGRLLALGGGTAIVAAVNQWLQIFPTWAGAMPILFYLFVWAPYRAWVRQHREVALLTARLTPAMIMSPMTRLTERGLTVGVVVRATTDAVLQGCGGHLTFGGGQFGSASGALVWSKQDGGVTAIDIASHAFLEVVQIDRSYWGSLKLCFASGGQTSFKEGEPDRPRVRIRISARNSASIEREFVLVIHPFGAHARPDGLGGWIEEKLPSVTLEPI